MKKERSPLQKFTWERGMVKGNVTSIIKSVECLLTLENTTFDERSRLKRIKTLTNILLTDWDRNHNIVKENVENFMKNRS